VARAVSSVRQEFERERRRSAFMSFLAGCGIGIIVTDTWVNHWFGVPGGMASGAAAYGLVYGFETLMWRRNHGR
jgi:hypothetical protein